MTKPPPILRGILRPNPGVKPGSSKPVPTSKPIVAGFTRIFPDWKTFIDFLATGYLKLPRSTRERLLFRGQGNSKWTLTPSLDRFRRFKTEDERNAFAETLLGDYRLAVQPLHERRLVEVYNAEEMEMHARHHGVPTRLIDWTQSPFVAAYFAIVDAMFTPADRRASDFAIYRYSPTRAGISVPDSFEVVPCDGRANPRAWAQRSVFIRLKSNDRKLEAVVPKAFSKYILPFSAAQEGIVWLDEMGVNPSVLFPDHDGAGKLVNIKHYDWGASGKKN